MTRSAEQPNPNVESPEKKSEIPPVISKNREGATIDRSYLVSVSGYFRDRKKDLMESIKQDPDDENLEAQHQFLADNGQALEKLANPKLLERMQPKDVSLALSELAGTMVDNDPNVLSRIGSSGMGYPAEQEKLYLETRKVFMDSCGKMFGKNKGVGYEKELTPERLRSEAEKVSRVVSVPESLISVLPDSAPKPMDARTWIKNPKETIRQVDGVWGKAALEMKSLELQGRHSDTEAERVSTKVKLASAVEAMYKMQLVRDKLMKQAYGRADMTPSEARKIDEALEAVGGKKPENSEKVEQREQGPAVPSPKRKEAGRTESREADSEQREKELIAKVLEESGVLVHTSFPDGGVTKSISRGGFHDLFDSYKGPINKLGDGGLGSNQHRMENQLNVQRSYELADLMKGHKVREIIGIHHEATMTYKTEVLSPEKKVLGIKWADEVTRKVEAGSKPVSHGDLIRGGKHEAAVTFFYSIPQQTFGARENGTDWICPDGRPGQMLLAKFILPESTATELERVVDENPAIMRRIIEASMRKDLDSKFMEKDAGTNKAMLPPWKQWDEETGGRVYVQKGEDTPGWHEENVHQVRK